MDRNSLLGVYDDRYARSYEETFLTNPFSKVSSDFELEVLKGLINDQTSWLDAGCGTGYYLSQFAGYKRAGLDLSPAMLALAKQANPDALFFREGDFRVDIPEWENRWSLVSCMWYPYSYLDSLGEFEGMLRNLINWTATGGDVFLPVADLDDFRPDSPHVPYEKYADVYQGPLLITSYTWTWIEHDGTAHTNMIAPHFEHVVRLMAPYFETIEVIRYPPAHEGWVSRKAVLARKKRAVVQSDGLATRIIRHPVPPSAYPNASKQANDGNAAMAISNRQLLGELLQRIKNGRLLKAVLSKIF